MNSSRRKVLQGTAVMGLALVAGLVKPAAARAEWNKAAFEVKNSLNDAVKALGGSGATENGAVVPFTVTSKLPKTESIALLVEKNPNILAANFFIPEGTEPWVNTRIKMGQTSHVIALVKADGKYYYTSKEVKVTLGGCGG